MFNNPFDPYPLDKRTVEQKAEDAYEWVHGLTYQDWFNALKESDENFGDAFTWLRKRGLSG